MAPTRATLHAGNLPVELTSFVGRRQGVADLKRDLAIEAAADAHGAGGVGKTKLALRAGTRERPQYPDGTWFVELAAMQDPELVTRPCSPRSACRTARPDCGCPVSLTTSPASAASSSSTTASTSSRPRPSLQRNPPRPSRRPDPRDEPAGARRDRRIVVDVPTLSLPEAARPPLAEALLSDAVALFVERAQAVDRDFHLDEDNAAAVASVCAKLDGMALAIELASVRLHALGLEALEQSLTARLGVLGTGDPTRPHRQQTLDATMDWSYRLLDDTERLLWRRLSIFAGGFEGGSAAEVCSDDALPADRIRDLVARLVERSILKRRDGPRGGRFRILEPLRQFGRERLEESGELTVMLRRHRDWIEPWPSSRVRPIFTSARGNRADPNRTSERLECARLLSQHAERG